ncbi:ABC transporter permease subunit [Cohnella sp. CFH 77786]|uniref:carbohydrate ABC transporter permease n=1 Tax=Cohnella sp. CFH 77786 TaxID=2662265 RepID=UPI001C60A668|nr:sugar ABC transporter permease [Cohnella sp. CFH 77786]MBW5445643.1 ABC transporter permease subunit [Cohnella sp. CFH 77786]
MEALNQPVPRGRGRGFGGGEQWRAVLFLSPSWLLLLLFFFVPTALTFYFAFTNMALTGEAAMASEFVGFHNFADMFRDPGFRTAVYNTMVYLVFSAVIGQQAVGFLLAFLMNGRSRAFRSIIGSIVLAGWVAPEVVCAFVWFAFLNDSGTVNMALEAAGLKPVAWLYSFPMVSVVIANIWHGTAFSMMVFQAALGDVPKEVEEAAMIDGASAWQRLVRVVLPMIGGSVVTNMVLVTLQTLGSFTMIYALTGGGPGNATETLPVYMYHQAFVNYQLGYGTAISLTLLVIGAAASLIYMKVLKVKI